SCLFYLSSRRRHTRSKRDWSSDVCSSDLADVLYRHAELLVETFGGNEDKAMRDIRKHVSWYFKGYPVGGDMHRSLTAVETLEQRTEERRVGKECRSQRQWAYTTRHGIVRG